MFLDVWIQFLFVCTLFTDIIIAAQIFLLVVNSVGAKAFFRCCQSLSYQYISQQKVQYHMYKSLSLILIVSQMIPVLFL
jgi:hypothetical protein